jgi:hypothetical protein
MNKTLRFAVLLISLLLVVSPVFAFNSGTHIYIAEKVYKKLWVPITLDLQYGSIAPDFSTFVGDPSKWDPLQAFNQTHLQYIDLRPDAWTFAQKAFAKGWITHNQLWGADWYAHIAYNGNGGYVTVRAEVLSGETGLPEEFTHFAVEAAIDLLLQENKDRFLGEKLLLANLLRNREDQNLLIRVLVWREKKTDLLTLVSTELTFRGIEHEYAKALAGSNLGNIEPLVAFGVAMAENLYGVPIDADDVRNLLIAAIGKCGDYEGVITASINGIYGELK